jgi:hypothetical protein
VSAIRQPVSLSEDDTPDGNPLCTPTISVPLSASESNCDRPLAAQHGICRLELIHFDNLHIRYELHKAPWYVSVRAVVLAVPVGVVRERDAERAAFTGVELRDKLTLGVPGLHGPLMAQALQMSFFVNGPDRTHYNAPAAVAFATCFRSAPAARRAFTSKSSDTDASPASILATRDWLEPRAAARSFCDMFRFCRSCFKLRLSASLASTYADSSAVTSRNSAAVPTAQPFALSLLRLAASIYRLGPPFEYMSYLT